MITSDKQNTAAKKQLMVLTASMAASRKKNVPDLIEKAGRNQLQELIDEIQRNIEEYDR